MEILIKVLQVILSLSILVVLHEGGHFLPAKWFKTRVEKFYLFFDPYFSLFKKKIGETEYGIGWLPFGGYVKIAGMIDESFDKEQMKGEPQPWEFRSKPAWQRFIIMVGGVTVNIIVGILIFIMMYFNYGTKYIPNQAVENGIYVDTLGYNMGLRNGDKILKFGEKDFDRFEPAKIRSAIVIDGITNLTVDRNGRTIQVPVDEKYAALLGKQDAPFFVGARIPYDIGGVFEGKKRFLRKDIEPGPAHNAGMLKDDKIVAVNGQIIQYYDEASKLFKSNANSPVNVSVLRNGETKSLTIRPNEEGKIGVMLKPLNFYYEPVTETHTFKESVVLGWNKSWNFLGSQLKAFKRMFTGQIKAKDSLGSIISIGNLFPGTWNWQSFWNITAILSLILGIMNLLPIPALDGGYIVFLFWEMITGRKVSDKTMEIANTIGFFLLIGLMLFALGLDFSRLF